MAHNKTPHLAEIKRKLAAKYARLSTLAGSQTKRAHFARKAENYRRQAIDIDRANGIA